MMEKIYKTYSWGGMEGRDLEADYWVSAEAAKEAAAKDNWNTGYTLYEVTLTVGENGRIKMTETKIGTLESGADRK
jgi:hypothetical protein